MRKPISITLLLNNTHYLYASRSELPSFLSSVPLSCRLQLPISAFFFANDTATASTKREAGLLDVLAKTGFPLNLLCP